jgi:LytS/YehU family sensor histidine kinase
VSYQSDSEIKISLLCRAGLLSFSVVNKVVRFPGEVNEQGSGIGLKNVRRRLELLYPGRHRLEIQEQDHQYSVELQIQI